MVLLSDAWQWGEAWKVQMDTRKTDEQGWQYSMSFGDLLGSTFHKTPGLMYGCRRRVHVRRAYRLVGRF